jgi:hypothetical protein
VDRLDPDVLVKPNVIAMTVLRRHVLFTNA